MKPQLPYPRTFRGRARLAALSAMALVGVVSAACSDDPFAFPWEERHDTVLLYSLARPELNLVSAFNFRTRETHRVEASTSTGSWDVALDTRGGQLVFLPPGALGVRSRARITSFPGMSFQDVVRAPEDTLVYTGVDPVPVELGTVYVFRTGQSIGGFGTNCVYYAKLEPLAVDVAGGTLRFVFDASPLCNDLRLVPP